MQCKKPHPPNSSRFLDDPLSTINTKFGIGTDNDPSHAWYFTPFENECRSLLGLRHTRTYMVYMVIWFFRKKMVSCRLLLTHQISWLARLHPEQFLRLHSCDFIDQEIYKCHFILNAMYDTHENRRRRSQFFQHRFRHPHLITRFVCELEKSISKIFIGNYKERG